MGSFKMTNEPKMVTITEDEYNSLLEDSRWLACLDAAGVDNWQGIDEAFKISNAWDAEEDAEED